MQATPTVRRGQLALFACGFRPFFLAAIAFAFVAIALWLVIRSAALAGMVAVLTVSKSVAIAYGVLCAAALVRVLATSVPEYYESSLKVAGSLWTLAFVILLATYGPILLRGRVDGREG